MAGHLRSVYLVLLSVYNVFTINLKALFNDTFSIRANHCLREHF